MTNKEKYFDKASPKELAKTLRERDNKCKFCVGCNFDGTPCEKRIEKWLSQEVK